MKFKITVLLAILAGPLVQAKETPETKETKEPPARETTLSTAANYRAELAASVAKNTETPESVLQRLSARAGASGLALSGNADLGYAALDVGRRLISLQRTTAAEVFFRAAEQAFAQAASQAAGPERVREKARYLQKLATVRASYLNKASQAKADIDEAIRLQPEAKSLKETRSQLARGRAEAFKKPTAEAAAGKK